MTIHGPYTGYVFTINRSDYMGAHFHLCFTDQNGRKWTPTISFPAYRHPDEAAAIQSIPEYDASIYIDRLPDIDYATYVAEAAKLGLPTEPFEWDSYAMSYWSAEVAGAGLAFSNAVALARKHQAFRDKQKAEAAAQAQTVMTPVTPQILRCKTCGEAGRAGAYPFSTLPESGRCDDCV